MDFHESQFPPSISKGSSGGPQRMTDVVTLRSGYEQRNSVWANSRRVYNAGLGLRNIEDIYDALAFFEARRGRLYGFRWKDWSDYKTKNPIDPVTSSDVEIGVGDGENRTFQLKKEYISGDNSWVRIITKPVSSTVKVSVDSIDLVEGDDFLVDYTTGFIYLGLPLTGSVKCGFEFDVPVRFDQDNFMINVEQFNAGAVPDIDIIELRVSYEKDIAKEDEAMYNWLQSVDINTAVNTNWNNVWGTV